MKPWQRNLLIIGIVCGILVLVFYSIFVVSSDLWVFLKSLLFIPAIGLLAGIVVAVIAVVHAITHERATLESGPGGSVNVEQNALEATAMRAISSIKDIRVQNVSSRMIAHKGDPMIDFKVTAIPYGTDSLMECAAQIQRSVKQAIETFTGREVRYVGVDFVEPRKRREVRDVKKASKEYAAERPQPTVTVEETVDIEDEGQIPPEQIYESAWDIPQTDEEEIEDEDTEEKSTLFDRIKRRISERRTEQDEDILETEAVVEDADAEEEDFITNFNEIIDESLSDSDDDEIVSDEVVSEETDESDEDEDRKTEEE